MSKRVLLIAPQPFFRWRGASIRVRHTALALAATGFEVDILTLPFGEDVDIPSVRTLRVSNPFPFVRDVPIGPSLRKVLFGLLILIKAFRLTWGERYQFLHCLEESALIGAALRRRGRRLLVFDKLGDLASYRKGLFSNLVMAVYRRLEAWPLRAADAVLAGAPTLVDQIRHAVPGQSVHHIFDLPSSTTPPDPDRVRAIRARLQGQGSGMVITYAGSFAEYQGIPLLVEAIPRVVQRHPDARFVIVGGSETEIAKLRSTIEQEASAAVTFLGRIPPHDLPNYLAASDILLCPRVAGSNIPLKLLDYLKAGIAIVATDQIGNRGLVDESVAVMARAEVSSFADAIVRAMEDEELRSRVARNGRRLAERSYSYEKFRRRLSRCYASLEGELTDHGPQRGHD